MEISSSSQDQAVARNLIFKTFLALNSSAAAANPFVGVTNPLLAKALSIYHVYKRIVMIPGDVVEFGVWYGQNLILAENLRSILEPFNIQRRFWGFDTFTGYPQDDSSGFGGEYAISREDLAAIRELIVLHQSANTPAHINNKISLVDCDIRRMDPCILPDLIALCMVDISDNEACRLVYQNVIPRMPSGSVLLIDDLTNPGQPECLKQFLPYLANFSLERCSFFSTRTLAVKR